MQQRPTHHSGLLLASNRLLDSLPDLAIDVAPVLEGTLENRFGHATLKVSGYIGYKASPLRVVHDLTYQCPCLPPVIVIGSKSIGGSYHLTVDRPRIVPPYERGVGCWSSVAVGSVYRIRGVHYPHHAVLGVAVGPRFSEH